MRFQNSVHVKAPVYVTRDLHLESTAVIDGAAKKAAIGRDLCLKNPQNQIGLKGGGDPRIAEIHVVNQCSSKDDPGAAPVRTVERPMGQRRDLGDAPGQRDPGGPPPFISFSPKLTCCAPYGGTIAPAGPLADRRTIRATWASGTRTPISGRSRPASRSTRLAAEVRHGERSPGQLDQLERDAHAR